MVRDDRGRYVKGQTGNPKGRPKKEREVEYYRILTMRCTVDDWNAIIDRAILDAKRGDAVARKFLADYLIGPPIERHEHSGKDGAPFVIQLSWGDNADADND